MAKRVRGIASLAPNTDAPTPNDSSDQGASIEEPKIEKPIESTASPSASDLNFDPLKKPVVEREYSSAVIDQAEVGHVIPEIQEPHYLNPSELAKQQEATAEAAAAKENGESSNPLDNPNEGFNELDNKDKKIAAAQVVDMVLEGYEELHKLGQSYVEFSDMKLAKMAIEGDFSLDMPVPIDENVVVPLRDFVADFNEQAKAPLQYNSEFGEKVRPAMLRVAMKHGWGVTDEQYLIFMFGKDITTKVGAAIALKKQMRDTIYLITESAKRASPQEQERMADQVVYKERQSERVEQEEITDEELEAEEELREQEGEEAITQKFDVGRNFGNKNPLSHKPNRKPPRPKVRTVTGKAGDR